MSVGTLYSDDVLCPFSHRVLVAADELGLRVEVVYGEEIPESARNASAAGTWPVFVPAGGGDPMDGSSRIVEHLIALAGPSGADYRSDAATLAMLDELVTCISKVIRAGAPAVQRDFRERLDRVLAGVERLRASSGGPFLGGERFSQADGHVAPFLYRLPFIVEIRNHVPRILLENEELCAWVDRVVRRPSFAAIAPKRHLVRQFYAERASYGKPMKVGRLHHSGFRGMWNDLTARVSAIAAGADETGAGLQEARDLCYLLFRAVALHAKFENLTLFPVLDAAEQDGFTAEGVAQHDHEVEEMNSLLARFDVALGEDPGRRRATVEELAAECERLREGQFAHLDYEETHFMPVLAGLEVDRHLAMIREAYQMCILERPHLIGVMASYMPIENVLSLLDSLSHAVEPDSEQWRVLLRAMHEFLGAEQWLGVARRFEDVVPISLLVVPVGHRRGSIGSAARALQESAPIDRIEIPHAPAGT